METTLSFLFAAAVGFGHAFEADHLVAVGNIVTKRDRLDLALKDGIYWGLGHSSTIILIGLIMVIGKATFPDGLFGYFESGVGLMLILLGLFRLYQLSKIDGSANHLIDSANGHQLAYGVGLVHGLAGSGAMILLVMTDIQGSLNSMIYLLIFGFGSVAGMLVAAGIFSMPFSRKLTGSHNIRISLTILSSLLCVGYGGYLMMSYNLM